jgi:redox-sensitive bicupin YhaK (pirin superfamily)
MIMKPDLIAHLLAPEVKDLGGFVARRLLPHDDLMMVGPFIFFDHLGPAVFPPGQGIDVRPHPHINLATVTYLFEGALLHRDSLGSVQEIQPGAVNWMTAGQGIVHSERSPSADRLGESRIHGIQTWVALPEADEETAPWFRHYPAADIPQWAIPGGSVTLVAGCSHDRVSPVRTYSPILYLDVQFLAAGAEFMLPAEYSERALYSVTPGLSFGAASTDLQPLAVHQLTVLNPGCEVKLQALQPSRCIIIGGEPLGERHKWWNFVSSRQERIEQAKQDWVAGQFAPVPEETEFIPLPSA